MDTIIVALIVGAFGGLFGSIAGPFLGHQLDRRRRHELRREERQRELRQMLEAMMHLARTQSSGLLEYQLFVTLGRSLEEARLRHLQYVQQLELKHPSFLWRPHRIEDEALRGLAIALEEANKQATVLLSDINLGWSQVGPEWKEKANEATQRIDRVLQDIDRRLDELDW